MFLIKWNPNFKTKNDKTFFYRYCLSYRF